MSGGMGRPRPAPTPAERSASPGRDERVALTAHCWVLDAPGPSTRAPGLLLEWRREGRAWLGLVAYVQRDDSARFRLIQRWIPAEALKPVNQG